MLRAMRTRLALHTLASLAVAGSVAGAVAGVLTSACRSVTGAPPQTTLPAPTPSAAAPRLVLLVVIDQLPAWSFAEKAPLLTGGIARLIAEGAVYTGEYPFAATFTATGHATLGTGATPAEHGIFANDWWDRSEERSVTSVGTTSGKAPTRLRLPALGDQVLGAGRGGKAVALSIKDRGAILPLGQRATAVVWYDAKSARLTSSAHYGPSPAWLERLATERPIRPRLEQAWTPRDPALLLAATGGPDDAEGEFGASGLGRAFPHAPANTPDPARAFVMTPLADEVLIEAALAAVDAEQLGADDAADLLVVSFSAHDYVAHAWGQESWEALDLLLRLDERLGAFLAALETRVGKNRLAVVLTADHGGAPLVERSRKAGRAGRRIPYDEIEAAAEAAAATVAGPGDHVAMAELPTLFLSQTARALPTELRARVSDAIAARLEQVPGLAGAWPVATLVGDCDARPAPLALFCRSIDRERAGEVYFAVAEGTVLHDRAWLEATEHGSAHEYDRLVPLIVVEPGRAAPLPSSPASRVSMLRVAPTLARLLGVPVPAGAHEPSL